MTQDEIIRMAREAGLHVLIQHRFVVEKHHQKLSPKLERFAALVAEATKEKIIDEWRMCVDADLEHGIKSSNERAWAKWQKEYPNVSKFAESVEKLK